jgi:cytochrome c-type biogenesis protein CcmH
MNRFLTLLLVAVLAGCGGSGNRTDITGTVTLDPQLAEQVSAEDAVFIFARPAEGPPMPLAAQRVQVQDLPFQFQLDDSQAMTDQTLSTAERVIVIARVAKSGQAMPRPGDLEGRSGVVAPGTHGLQIVIDRVLD